MPTVPIPAEIVGDTPTIRARLQQSDYTTSSLVRACAHRIRSTGEVGPHFTKRLLEEGERNDALLSESMRRSQAYSLAHPRGLA